MSLLTYEVYYHSEAAEGSTQTEVTPNQWQDGTVFILANINYLVTLITSFFRFQTQTVMENVNNYEFIKN